MNPDDNCLTTVLTGTGACSWYTPPEPAPPPPSAPGGHLDMDGLDGLSWDPTWAIQLGGLRDVVGTVAGLGTLVCVVLVVFGAVGWGFARLGWIGQSPAVTRWVPLAAVGALVIGGLGQWCGWGALWAIAPGNW